MLSALLLLACALELQVAVSSDDVQIGEPIVCTVDLDAIDGPLPTLESEELLPTRAWVVLEEPSIRRSSEGAQTLTWTLIALEPAPGAMPTPALLQSGAPLALQGPLITVAGELAEDEDAPRAARGFHVPSLSADASAMEMWHLALAGFALLSLGLWVLRRRRRVEPEEWVSFTERLEALRGEAVGDTARLTALHSELTYILRAAHGDEHVGWSDEEWIERAELSESQRIELRGILASCAEVKYGGGRPTRFAVEETLDRARALLAEAEEVAA